MTPTSIAHMTVLAPPSDTSPATFSRCNLDDQYFQLPTCLLRFPPLPSDTALVYYQPEHVTSDPLGIILHGCYNPLFFDKTDLTVSIPLGGAGHSLLKSWSFGPTKASLSSTLLAQLRQLPEQDCSSPVEGPYARHTLVAWDEAFFIRFGVGFGRGIPGSEPFPALWGRLRFNPLRTWRRKQGLSWRDPRDNYVPLGTPDPWGVTSYEMALILTTGDWLRRTFASLAAVLGLDLDTVIRTARLSISEAELCSWRSNSATPDEMSLIRDFLHSCSRRTYDLEHMVYLNLTKRRYREVVYWNPDQGWLKMEARYRKPNPLCGELAEGRLLGLILDAQSKLERIRYGIDLILDGNLPGQTDRTRIQLQRLSLKARDELLRQYGRAVSLPRARSSLAFYRALRLIRNPHRNGYAQLPDLLEATRLMAQHWLPPTQERPRYVHSALSETRRKCLAFSGF